MTTLADLLQLPNVELVRAGDADLNQTIADVRIDSRAIAPGDLFVAVSGARADGHDYVEAVASSGAAAVVVSQDIATLPNNPAVLRVPDGRAALPSIASAVYRAPSLEATTVAITGTNGKTTTTFILESLFGDRTGVIGTVNYRWRGRVEAAPNTTPESVVLQRLMRRMVDDGVDTVVLEASSHGLATHRLDETHVDIALFTNLTQDHLDFHGSMDDYRAAKARLFLEWLPRAVAIGKHPAAVINVDDPKGRRLAGLVSELEDVRLLTFGIEESADVTGNIESMTTAGMTLRVQYDGRDIVLQRLPIFGRFNASNVMGAVGCGLAALLSDEAIVNGLARLGQIPGRLQLVASRRDQPAVFVDYAHTPDALERALESLREICDGRLIVVFGCGGDRDQQKRPIMGQVAANGADMVYVTSDNPRHEDPLDIIHGILGGIEDGQVGEGLVIEADRRRAIRAAVTSADPADVVLIAGKGHETYQEVGDSRLDFNDVSEVEEALA